MKYQNSKGSNLDPDMSEKLMRDLDGGLFMISAQSPVILVCGGSVAECVVQFITWIEWRVGQIAALAAGRGHIYNDPARKLEYAHSSSWVAAFLDGGKDGRPVCVSPSGSIPRIKSKRVLVERQIAEFVRCDAHRRLAVWVCSVVFQGQAAIRGRHRCIRAPPLIVLHPFRQDVAVEIDLHQRGCRHPRKKSVGAIESATVIRLARAPQAGNDCRSGR